MVIRSGNHFAKNNRPILKPINKLPMYKILLFIFLFHFAENVSAQEACTVESVMAVKGNWKKVPDANMRYSKDQTAIISRIDHISELFKSAYPEPRGMEAAWYRTMDNESLISNGPVPYNFNSLYKAWYCNQHVHKMLPGGETGTWAYVFVNSFDWFFSDRDDPLHIHVNGKPVNLMPQKTGEWKGYPVYQTYFGEGRDHFIILTHHDQLPWKAISQEQYLQVIRQRLADQKKESSSGYAVNEENIKKSIANNQNNKNLKEEDKIKMNAFLQKQLDEIQKSQGENVAKANKYLDDKIAVIDDYIKKAGSATLQQPAIMDKKFVGDFTGTFSTEEKGGKLLVILNTEYFNLKLPNYVPQMMILFWSWEKNAPSQDFKKQFEENFPVEKLKDMLDK